MSPLRARDSLQLREYPTVVDKTELFSGRVQPGGADRYLNSHGHSVERTQCRGRAQNAVEGLTGFGPCLDASKKPFSREVMFI